MDLKFVQTSWQVLRKIGGNIERSHPTNQSITNARKDLRKKIIAGVSEVIRAEMRRVEMAGLEAKGRVVLSMEFKIEFDENPSEPPPPKKKNLLAELDDILNKNTPKKDLLEY